MPTLTTDTESQRQTDGLQTLADLLAWLQAAPHGVMIPASTLALQLGNLLTNTETNSPAQTKTAGAPVTWRERLWTCPADTRLGVSEVAEALGRPKSWVYRRTGAKSRKARLPHRQLDGELVFIACELRRWLESHETKRAAARFFDR